MSSPRIVLVLLVALAALEFAVRGPVRWIGRGDSRANDLTGPYLAARAWTRGLNPYRSDVYWTLAEESGLDVRDRSLDERPPDDFQANTPYPVTAFVLLAPLAPFRWPGARLLAVGASTGIAIAAVLLVMTLAPTPARRYLLAAAALALAPLQTGIGSGNLAAPAAACVVVAVCWMTAGRSSRAASSVRSGRDIAAGVALGVAACLKPPVAAPILVWCVVRGRWRAWLSAAAFAGVVAAIGALRLSAAGVPWLADYVKSNRLLLTNHGATIIEENPMQAQFTNLQFPGLALFHDALAANRFALAVGAALAAVWLVLVLRRRRAPAPLLETSAVAVISLLPVYHRIYDAALLLLPLAWTLAPDSDGRDDAPPLTRRVVLFVLLAFLVPSATIVETLTDGGSIPPTVAESWGWRVLVVPHQPWLLLVLAVALLAALARRQAFDSD